jgi:hypothetical protein
VRGGASFPLGVLHNPVHRMETYAFSAVPHALITILLETFITKES